MDPWQLLGLRRHWGEMPLEVEAEAWRAQLRDSCPILHDVMLQERDEFMTYRILLALELRLARGMPSKEALLVLCGPAHVEELLGSTW